MGRVLDNASSRVISWAIVVFAKYEPPLQAVLDDTSGCAIGGFNTEFSENGSISA